MGNYCLKRCCLWNLEWEFSGAVEKRQVMMQGFGSQQIQSSIKSKCTLVMVVRQVKGVINHLQSCKISLCNTHAQLERTVPMFYIYFWTLQCFQDLGCRFCVPISVRTELWGTCLLHSLLITSVWSLMIVFTPFAAAQCFYFGHSMC